VRIGGTCPRRFLSYLPDSFADTIMTPFFTRLKFAFKAFFVILFNDRLPDEVAAAYGPKPMPIEPEAEAPEPTATQLLAVLQRDGRLVDFLMEDIAPYGDAQVGAAVRSVHAGCRQALEQYVTLAPVIEANEGSRVTIEAGTDAARVKLVGNVAGYPPFTGVLQHRGWMVSRAALPALPPSGRVIVAPAEVEVS
jgi:hypothetical protein